MASLLVVVGGAGALGSAFIAAANARAMRTVCIDLRPNPDAQQNIGAGGEISVENIKQTLDQSQSLSMADRGGIGTLVVVVCTAGSWSGGALTRPVDQTAADQLYRTNLRPALLAANLAALLAASGSADVRLVLTSAHASLGPTPSMAAYGAVKAAVNHVAQSAAASGVATLLLLPAVLDTAANRAAMGEDAAGTTWTPCHAIAEHVLANLPPQHAAGKELPPVRLNIVTKAGKTSFEAI